MGIVVVLRNPLYFVMLILLGLAGYITYSLNLWGPMIRMVNAASQQAVEVGKERLREFLENSEASRQVARSQSAIAMSSGDGIAMINQGKSARSEEIVDGDDE